MRCTVLGMTSNVDIAVEPWTATDASFGARLALIRQRMGWGNVKLAAFRCGIPAQSWRTWERDHVLPRDYIVTCGIIAEATGCDYGWLVDRRPSGTSKVSDERLAAKLDAPLDNPAQTSRLAPRPHRHLVIVPDPAR